MQPESTIVPSTSRGSKSCNPTIVIPSTFYTISTQEPRKTEVVNC